ncbi:MAG: secondary thiamine-phosphate synthase enzyme YjbQ [Archaeoglobales archaeon]|nr:secondary thiamine-phosphate synthase enzyme YjbQ [Archaeoglobales archaeon]
MEVIEIETKKRVEVIDITEEVEKRARGDAMIVYTPHTTAAIIINEAEDGLMEDIIEILNKLAPENGKYKHNRIDNNADAHLKASLLGNSVIVPVSNGKILLGTWQRILFLEFDGPRRRKVIIKEI